VSETLLQELVELEGSHEEMVKEHKGASATCALHFFFCIHKFMWAEKKLVEEGQKLREAAMREMSVPASSSSSVSDKTEKRKREDSFSSSIDKFLNGSLKMLEEVCA
jgi:hypothetical protein